MSSPQPNPQALGTSASTNLQIDRSPTLLVNGPRTKWEVVQAWRLRTALSTVVFAIRLGLSLVGISVPSYLRAKITSFAKKSSTMKRVPTMRRL